METIWHCHLDLDDLIGKSDDMLAQILKGGTSGEMRTKLIGMKSAGKRYLVVGGCDKQDQEGKCAGHPA